MPGPEEAMLICYHMKWSKADLMSITGDELAVVRGIVRALSKGQ